MLLQKNEPSETPAARSIVRKVNDYFTRFRVTALRALSCWVLSVNGIR